MDWIKCCDELPDRFEIVLLYNRQKKEILMGWRETNNKEPNHKYKILDQYDLECDKNITHWLPLPRPPKDNFV